MHHLRANKTIGTVILSPEEQRRRALLQQADSEMEHFFDENESYEERIEHLDQALHIAHKANDNKIVARRLERK